MRSNDTKSPRALRWAQMLLTRDDGFARLHACFCMRKIFVGDVAFPREAATQERGRGRKNRVTERGRSHATGRERREKGPRRRGTANCDKTCKPKDESRSRTRSSLRFLLSVGAAANSRSFVRSFVPPIIGNRSEYK